MKKLALTLIAALFITSLFAQEDVDTSASENTKIRVGKRSLVLGKSGIGFTNPARKRADSYWGGLGFGFNVLTGPNQNVTLQGADTSWQNEPIKSMTINLNVYGEFIPLTRDRNSLGLITGLGLTYKSFGLSANNLDVVTSSKNTELVPNTDSTAYNKRKFRVAYLSVPLMIGFNTSSDKKRNFHLSAGVIGNLRVGSIYKRKYVDEGDNEIKKIKQRRDFNLSPLTVDLTVRAGYRRTTFFVTYGLASIFRSGKGPDVNPLTLGVRL